jgi:hypothetical protein
MESEGCFLDNFNEQNDRKLQDDDYNEEAAAEVLPLPNQGRVVSRERDDFEDNRTENVEKEAGRGMGFFALILSIASLFFLPVLLGAAGIIVGFVARRRGARSLGNWAIGLGIASIVVSLLFAPFF